MPTERKSPRKPRRQPEAKQELNMQWIAERDRRRRIAEFANKVTDDARALGFEVAWGGFDVDYGGEFKMTITVKGDAAMMDEIVFWKMDPYNPFGF